ncbi:DUF192 domain-containing protein [Novosphingobium sp. Gsoil 351]|uniref:DUF192 domain-containing protein n=1 Tax=Novosphingobium sp. Gsoil 351 TaxID=2675225 RepID=UPI0012B47DB9|nr:DUF192 domain-containing protein [Novosphingobium sp. Gsoil 351]QGN54793.1 DUF192 domain-containing protein [Novosphingobium sp. Gsoil 351]
MSVRVVFYAVLAALAACSPMSADAGQKAAASAPVRHPISGLEVVPLSIASANGRHEFRVEIARTDTEWEKGLMFRTSMGADEGMIFVDRPPQRASFWMKNTVIPLDMVFVGPDRRIESIAPDAVPYSLAPISSQGPVVAILELNGGRAAQLGLAIGDRVEW